MENLMENLIEESRMVIFPSKNDAQCLTTCLFAHGHLTIKHGHREMINNQKWVPRPQHALRRVWKWKMYPEKEMAILMGKMMINHHFFGGWFFFGGE